MVTVGSRRQASESRAGFADAHMCCREIAAGACKGFGPGEHAMQTRGGGVSRELQSCRLSQSCLLLLGLQKGTQLL